MGNGAQIFTLTRSPDTFSGLRLEQGTVCSTEQMLAFQVCELVPKHIEGGARVRAKIQKYGNCIACSLNEYAGPKPTFCEYQFFATMLRQVINPRKQSARCRRGFKVRQFQGRWWWHYNPDIEQIFWKAPASRGITDSRAWRTRAMSPRDGSALMSESVAG